MLRCQNSSIALPIHSQRIIGNMTRHLSCILILVQRMLKREDAETLACCIARSYWKNSWERAVSVSLPIRIQRTNRKRLKSFYVALPILIPRINETMYKGLVCCIAHLYLKNMKVPKLFGVALLLPIQRINWKTLKHRCYFAHICISTMNKQRSQNSVAMPNYIQRNNRKRPKYWCVALPILI